MESLFNKFVWFFTNADAHQVVAPLVLPFAIAFGLYQSHYPFILMRALWERVVGDGFVPLTRSNAPALGMTMPTLLRDQDDLDGLTTGIGSALRHGYPGQLILVAVIDGLDVAPKLVDALRTWAAAQDIPSNIHLRITGSATRVGKATAGDLGIRTIAQLSEELIREGVLCEMPPIYFNMDADCELGAHALERMVIALKRPSRLTGQPAMIVTSHVSIREADYWKGVRHFFTLKGQIAVTVAREYLVAIGLGRHNAFRMLPQNGASGALYCTWFPIVEAAPYYASFLNTLTWGDWVKWWFGAPPPRFDVGALESLPEAMTGMGEDTWMSWLAIAARFEHGKITLGFPRTPAHALWYALVGFFARPFRYDPQAKIYTTTPTNLKSLFSQRVRWNVSRIWTVQCWGPALFYHLVIGIPAIFDVVLATAFQAVIAGGLILAPLLGGDTPAMAPALFVLVELGYFVERMLGTTIAMVSDRGEKGRWKKFLGLPFAGIFHIAFNVVTTVVGFSKQVFGNGYNDKFAPETTLIKGATSRVALGFRIRRFYGLCVRSVIVGDVPLGAFWFGWHKTKWTPNGYEGWTTGKVPSIVRLIEDPTPLALVPAANDATQGMLCRDDIPNSGVRRRPSMDKTPDRIAV